MQASGGRSPPVPVKGSLTISRDRNSGVNTVRSLVKYAKVFPLPGGEQRYDDPGEV